MDSVERVTPEVNGHAPYAGGLRQVHDLWSRIGQRQSQWIPDWTPESGQAVDPAQGK